MKHIQVVYLNGSNSVLRQSVTQMFSVSPFVLGDQREREKKNEKSMGRDSLNSPPSLLTHKNYENSQ